MAKWKMVVAIAAILVPAGKIAQHPRFRNERGMYAGLPTIIVAEGRSAFG